MRRALPVLILLAALFGLYRFQDALVRAQPEGHDIELALFLPPPETLKIAALGFDSVVTDGLWINAVQLFGENFSKEMNPVERRRFEAAFARLIDITTAIDPDWRTVFVNGGSMLGVLKLDDAAAIINARGTQSFPGDWYFPFHLGMHYWDIGRRAKAADYIGLAAEHAADDPKAPWYLSGLAATMMQYEDRDAMALVMLKEQLQRITVPKARVRTELRLLDATLCSGRNRLQKAMEDSLLWSNTADRDPESLMRRGYLDEIPECPLGGPWEWNVKHAAFHCRDFDGLRREFMIESDLGKQLWDMPVACP